MASLSTRPVEALHPKTYLSTDILDGPGVDLVCAAEGLPKLSADVVVSCDTLEHTSNWKTALLGMVMATRYGGFVLITAPSLGFPYHCAPDNWRFSVEQMTEALTACGLDVLDIRKAVYPDQPEVLSLSRRVRDFDTRRLSEVWVDKSWRSITPRHNRI